MHWRDVPGSTFSVTRHSAETFRDVAAIWLRLRSARPAATGQPPQADPPPSPPSPPNPLTVPAGPATAGRRRARPASRRVLGGTAATRGVGAWRAAAAHGPRVAARHTGGAGRDHHGVTGAAARGPDRTAETERTGGPVLEPDFTGVRVAIANWRDPWHPEAGGAERYAWEMAAAWSAGERRSAT